MNWGNIFGNILSLVAIPILIYIFYKVWKMEKKSKKVRQELIDLYSQSDREEKE